MKNEMEISEKEEIKLETTKIIKMKRSDRIMTMKIRTVKQLDTNDFNRYPGVQPTEKSLYPDELDLIIAYRVMNQTGKHSLLKVAQDFAMTPTTGATGEMGKNRNKPLPRPALSVHAPVDLRP